MAAASFAGSLYAIVFFLIFPMTWYSSILLSLAVSCLICIIAFKFNGLKDLFLTTAAFFSVLSLLDGTVQLIAGKLIGYPGYQEVFTYGIYSETQDNKVFAIVFILNVFIVLFLLYNIRMKSKNKQASAASGAPAGKAETE
ncbi:MAG TPA: sigma-E processing peptidase SpoIIGA [Bacillota bacterium]|nr:sigma-E processing peptidase SpoIIGA [Bacillota bacterium]